ncbi:MAG: glycosyltransferase [Proteobacteria bacterium]|nr:glycosyltransferase [Pseudomonadota bacterium]NDC23247.1 glycosyltransferase [Pseudomonadota bacterium]NDD03469.1 glycosyltransferase [Pseudomonadota bacterium]NDG25803.1 glycosyltransferase [Pseudomonadota bacterium]
MKHSLSIITAIHNGLPMNRLFWKALSQNTQSHFELIVVDNHSTDGSEKFFESLASQTRARSQRVVYLRNETNQSYPQSQIQGMEKAQYPVLCFLNNDIWMPKGWDQPFLDALEKNSLLILSPSGQEAQPTQRESDLLKRRWKHVLWCSKVWASLFRKTEEDRLWKSLQWMYGDLDSFSSPTRGPKEWMPGIKGDSVILHRNVTERLGTLWDPHIQAADWHLYLKAAKLHEEDPSFPLPRILLKTYIHHFGKYSARQNYEALPPGLKFKSIDEVWGQETVQKLWWGYHLP